MSSSIATRTRNQDAEIERAFDRVQFKARSRKPKTMRNGGVRDDGADEAAAEGAGGETCDCAAEGVEEGKAGEVVGGG